MTSATSIATNSNQEESVVENKARFFYYDQEWGGDEFDFFVGRGFCAHNKPHIGDVFAVTFGKYLAFKIWPEDGWKRMEKNILVLFEENTNNHNLQWFSDVVLGFLALGRSVLLKFSAKNREFSRDSYTTLDWWHAITVFYNNGKYDQIVRLTQSCQDVTIDECLSLISTVKVCLFANDALHLASEYDSRVHSLMELYKIFYEPRRSLMLVGPATCTSFELRELGASSELLDDRQFVQGPAILELTKVEGDEPCRIDVAVNEIAHIFHNSSDSIFDFWQNAKQAFRLAFLSSLDREFRCDNVPRSLVFKPFWPKNASKRLHAYYADLAALTFVLSQATPQLSSFVISFIVEWLPYFHILGPLKILRCIDSVRRSVAVVVEQRAQKKIKL